MIYDDNLFHDYDTMFNLYCVEGKTLIEIGEMFNKSRAQVFGKMKKLNIGRFDYKKQLHNQGKSKCNKCCEIKPLDHFTYNPKREVLNGIKPTCKSCDSKIGRDWYINNSQLTKDRAKKHREDNPERHRELSRKKMIKSRREKPHVHRLKGLLGRFIKATKQNKTMTTTVLVGYSYDDFKSFVEKSELPIKGNHVDHKCPISWMYDNVPPHIANSLDNLQIITEHENETKSQWWSHPIPVNYYNLLKEWIKDEYKDRFILHEEHYVDIKSPYCINRNV